MSPLWTAACTAAAAWVQAHEQGLGTRIAVFGLGSNQSGDKAPHSKMGVALQNNDGDPRTAMKRSISIPVPEPLLEAIGGSRGPLRSEFRRQLAVWLLAEGRLTVENAAAMGGVSVGELLQDAETARSQVPERTAPLPTALPHQSDRDWPHAPLHRLSKFGTYIVTSGTYQNAALRLSPLWTAAGSATAAWVQEREQGVCPQTAGDCVGFKSKR